MICFSLFRFITLSFEEASPGITAWTAFSFTVSIQGKTNV